MVERHGPLGTAPADLVRLVLDEKDLIIEALESGFKSIPRESTELTKEGEYDGWIKL